MATSVGGVAGHNDLMQGARNIAILSNGSIIVATKANISSKTRIALYKSTDGGATFSLFWSAPDFFGPSNTPIGNSNGVSICVDSANNVHLAIGAEDTVNYYDWVYYAKVNSSGTTVYTNAIISSSYNTPYPSIATNSNGSYVYIAFYHVFSTTKQIYLSKSTDGGSSFSTAQLYGTFDMGAFFQVDFVDSTHIMYLYTAQYGGLYRFICQMDTETTASTVNMISTSSAYLVSKGSFAVDSSGTIHAAGLKNGNIVYYKSTNLGATWSSEVTLASSAMPPYITALYINVNSNDVISVAYSIASNPSDPSTSTLYLIYSNDEGSSWSLPITLKSPGTNVSGAWQFMNNNAGYRFHYLYYPASSGGAYYDYYEFRLSHYKYWTGTAWNTAKFVKRWSGTQWVVTKPTAWTGTTWKQIT